MPEGPDQPLQLTTDQLSKLGITNTTPGESVLITARVTFGGTPDAPTAEITAAGNQQPDDPSMNLTPLSDDQPEPDGDEGMAADIPDDGAPPAPAGGEPDGDEKVLGFKRDAKPKKNISAKEVFGDE